MPGLGRPGRSLMFNVGPAELLVILTLGLIVLGPTKLPQVARQIGKVVTEMRQMAAGFKAEMDSAFEDTTPTSPQARAPLAPPAPVPEAPPPGDPATPLAPPAPVGGSAADRSEGDGLEADEAADAIGAEPDPADPDVR